MDATKPDDPNGTPTPGQKPAMDDAAFAQQKAAYLRERSQLAEERMNTFRQQVGPLVRGLTPEQRTILARELDKVLSATPSSIPPPVDQHAQLHAIEEAKIRAAEAAVRGGSLLGPAVRAGATDEVSPYEKIGDQWRVFLGSADGHDRYRWLSKQEAIALGLEKDDAVPSDQDLGLSDGPYDPPLGDASCLPSGSNEHLFSGEAAPHVGAQSVENFQGTGPRALDQEGKQER